MNLFSSKTKGLEHLAPPWIPRKAQAKIVVFHVSKTRELLHVLFGSQPVARRERGMSTSWADAAAARR